MEKKFNIGINPLSEEEIRSKNISLDDLWLIRIGEHILGPYLTVDLAEYSKENEELFETVFAFHVETEKWKPFYSVKYFQRRTPKLVPVQSLEKDSLWFVLKEGRKEGPYNFDDIKAEVEKNNLLLSDQISNDGVNWIKIYQHLEFDRRNFITKNEKLPFSPSDDTFANSKNKTEEILNKLKDIKSKESDILASFANLRNIQNKNQNPIQEEIEKEESIPNEESVKKSFNFLEYFQNLNQKSKLIFTLAGISFFLFIYLVSNYSNENSSVNQKFTEKNEGLEQKNKNVQSNNRPSIDKNNLNQISNKAVQKNNRVSNKVNTRKNDVPPPPSTSPNFRRNLKNKKVKHVNRSRARTRGRALSNYDEENNYNEDGQRNDREEDYSRDYDSYDNPDKNYESEQPKKNLLDSEQPIEHQEYEDPRENDYDYGEPREVEY